VVILLYIAKHKLIIGQGAVVKKGQYVHSGVNIPEAEIPGLLQIGAIEAAENAPTLPAETQRHFEPENTSDSNGGTETNIFASKAPEEIAKMFKKLDKEEMIELAAEYQVFDLSMEMSREQIIAVLVENNVAP
jgi:hypothetical protein